MVGFSEFVDQRLEALSKPRFRIVNFWVLRGIQASGKPASGLSSPPALCKLHQETKNV